MGIRTMLARLRTTETTETAVECRQCGTNVSSDTAECPECGSDEIACYRIQT